MIEPTQDKPVAGEAWTGCTEGYVVEWQLHPILVSARPPRAIVSEARPLVLAADEGELDLREPPTPIPATPRTDGEERMVALHPAAGLSIGGQRLCERPP